MQNLLKNFKHFLILVIGLSFIGGAVIAGAYGMKAYGNIRQGMKLEEEKVYLELLENIKVDLSVQIVSEKANEFKKTNEIEKAEKELRTLNEDRDSIIKRRDAIANDIEKNICDQSVSRAQIERLSGKEIPKSLFKIVEKFDCAKRFENVPEWFKTETVSERVEVVVVQKSGDFTPTADWVHDLRNDFDEHLAGFDNNEVWVD